MSTERRFENPKPLSKQEAEEALASGEPQRIAECLVALAFYEEDAEYVWGKILACTESVEPGVRGIAILCVGHMARLHGWIPESWARAAVKKALNDPDEFVRGHAVSATDDIQMFIRNRVDESI